MNPLLQTTISAPEKPNFPYDITFVDCEPSPAMHARIERHLAKLSRFHDRIIDAEVAVRIPHKHGHHRFFHIHVKVDLPGHQVVVTREPEEKSDHTAISVAIHDAFDKVVRQLETYLDVRRNYKSPQLTTSLPRDDA